jgi:signal transduction histidine kinase
VGLTFVKKIVERHSGRIWLESEPGKGAVFYFSLDQARHRPLTDLRHLEWAKD